ncbi:MAG: NAD-dependent epimerase/dehydratase family protein, partial [Bacteroidia bacterium]|nr:NAD-dependent epimerase/dehydratase family protein [Bacteroidia bacterium]
MESKTLIIGACGQIGSELCFKLRKTLGEENVIASDISTANREIVDKGKFEIIDAKDPKAIKDCVKKHNVDTIYLMAAMLSAVGEKFPEKAWDLNMTSLFNVLNLARDGYVKKVFWPSSIAVFGPSTPKHNTPQQTIMEPTTVYGMSKLSGERWCNYYFNKYNVDIRSVRYPGIISWKTQPGGGTTDYAIEIYHKALEHKTYRCFLEEDTELPMMYMEDAIDATLQIMNAPKQQIKQRSSYNLAAISFTPKQIAEKIKRKVKSFEITYKPDYRQAIASSWPAS